MRRIEIEEGVFISPQPSEAELQALADQGIRSVINLRTARGEQGAFPTQDERRLVENAGIRYIHLPLDRDAMGDDAIETFCKNLASAPKPVLVHARENRRAAAVVLADRAVRESWDTSRTLEHARALDLNFGDIRLQRALETYVDAHSAKRIRGRGQDRRPRQKSQGRKTPEERQREHALEQEQVERIGDPDALGNEAREREASVERSAAIERDGPGRSSIKPGDEGPRTKRR